MYIHVYYITCIVCMYYITCILQAYVVLGQFLLVKKDDEMFEDWVKDTVQANAKQARDCCACLRDWCEANL